MHCKTLSRSHLLRSDLWPISFQAPTENVPGCQIDPIQLSSPHLLCPPAITPSTPSSLHPQKSTSTPKPRKPSESKPHPPSLQRKRHRQQNSLRPTDQHTSNLTKSNPTQCPSASAPASQQSSSSKPAAGPRQQPDHSQPSPDPHGHVRTRSSPQNQSPK